MTPAVKDRLKEAVKTLEDQLVALDRAEYHFATLVTNIMRKDANADDLSGWLKAMQEYCVKNGLKPAPEPCGLPSPDYVRCPHMKKVGGGLYGEEYRCAICDNCYELDYEDMK